MTPDDETVAHLVARTAAASGVPERVDDPVVIDTLAALIREIQSPNVVDHIGVIS